MKKLIKLFYLQFPHKKSNKQNLKVSNNTFPNKPRNPESLKK